MRKGIAGLSALTQDVLRQKPASGAVFAFRGRRAIHCPATHVYMCERGIKLLYWDDQGFCLYYKVLERGRFPWPSARDGAVRMTSAQLAMLWAPLVHAGMRCRAVDDTPIRVLDRSRRDKGLGKGVKQGRIWAYVRDQRSWGGASPPGVVYRFAPNWKEEHVLSHLADARGILQAPSRGLKANHCRAMDGYKGYAKLYVPEPGGVPRLREAACWAHLTRDFHDFWASTKSEIAREALDRIGKLYDIERDIRGQPADVRHAARQQLSQPKVVAFFAWSEQQLLRIPGKSDLAKAFRYGLSRQEAFSLFLSDGRVAIDNNPAGRALRPIGIGRKNWLFAGADTGAETLARAMTIIETAKSNGLDPQAYLGDSFDRIHDHKINRLDELLPWNWGPLVKPQADAA